MKTRAKIGDESEARSEIGFVRRSMVQGLDLSGEDFGGDDDRRKKKESNLEYPIVSIGEKLMESERSTELEDRLKSMISHLHTESGILDRLVYKNKNQHRRCPYFKPLLKVRRDLKLLQSAALLEILSVVLPIIDGKKPAQKAFLPKKQKKVNPKVKYNYQERLLGAARLLSQMAEPILNSAIQISFLLAKSFFTGFSLTTLALLARLRVLVQQILLDIVVVYNKVSSLSVKKHSVKLTQGGIEAFREYYPSNGEVLSLECVWEKDKFVLLERTDKSNMKNQIEDQGSLPSETSLKHETMHLFGEDSFAEHDRNSEETPSENFAIDMQPIMAPSEGQSAKSGEGANAIDCQRLKTDVMGLICHGPPSKFSDEMAFISEEKLICSETDVGVAPNKKVKVDLHPTGTLKADDPNMVKAKEHLRWERMSETRKSVKLKNNIN